MKFNHYHSSSIKLAFIIGILLAFIGCKRSAQPASAEDAPKAGESTVSESEGHPVAEPADSPEPKPNKYRSASSGLEAMASDSTNKTVCAQKEYGDSEDPSQFCECGDIIIPGGTECIDGMPACNGHKAVTAIPGFGCVKDNDLDDDKANNKDVEYLCGLTWGCDLGNGKKCKYTQKLVNGECVSTVAPHKGDFVCEEGNCACGDGFCALGAKCVQGKCECGYSDVIKHCPDCYDEDDDEVDDEDQSECECRLEEIYGVTSQLHGEFVCDYWEEGGTSSTSEVYYHQCDNPDGCYIGDMHFAHGALDYTGSTMSLSYGSSGWELWHLKNNNYGCMYHIDADTDTSIETLCPMGDCVIPKKDGHCGTIGMAPSAFHNVEVNHSGEYTVYDAETCPGGTRWCHGRNNPPEIVPKGDSLYACYEVPRIGDSIGLRAWVCDDDSGCVCGNELCFDKMICTNNHCIAQHEYIKKMGKPYNTGYPKSTEGRPLYDPNFYTTDPADLERCGRKSAEEFVQRWEPSVDIDAISKYMGHKIEFDPCLTRHFCDSWPVPRKDRDKYVCEHGLYAQKTSDGRMLFADRPLGLRCIDPKECPCGQKYGMKFTAKAGELCLPDTFDAGASTVYDSVSQNVQCKWEIGKDIDSQYKFWHDYVPSVNPSDFFNCRR